MTTDNRSYVKDLMTELTELFPTINTVRDNEYASNKMSQLRIALKAGFKVPDTRHGTLGNTKKLHDLVNANAGAVYKPIRANLWPTKQGKAASLQTTSLAAQDWKFLSEMGVEEQVPAIYQSLLKKRCEYRVTVIGSDIFAMRQMPKGDYQWADWRSNSEVDFTYTEAKISKDTKHKILEILKSFNLHYGALDILETEEGELVFLEVNPGGQFLFCEERVPSLHILSSMTSNLCSFANMQMSQEQSLVLESKVSFQAFLQEHPDGVFLDEQNLVGFGTNDFFITETHSLTDVWDRFDA